MCPKCGSHAWDGASCVLCGYEAGQRLDDGHRAPDADRWWEESGDRSLRRLQAAWAERDRQLDGDGEETMPDTAKVYRCEPCGKTFPTREAWAGHGNSRKHQERVPRPAPPPSREVPEDALWADPPPAPAPAGPPANGGGLHCPLCCQALPGTVRVVAETFAREGVDEKLAVKLAAMAHGLLRVPA